MRRIEDLPGFPTKNSWWSKSYDRKSKYESARKETLKRQRWSIKSVLGNLEQSEKKWGKDPSSICNLMHFALYTLHICTSQNNQPEKSNYMQHKQKHRKQLLLGLIATRYDSSHGSHCYMCSTTSNEAKEL